MSSKKIITVFGATGLQGGSIASIFLTDPELKENWVVRAVTRDVSKQAARDLADQGAEIVSANFDDEHSLTEALKGSEVAFGVTNYYERADGEYEIQQGKNLADAVKEADVGHYIWSSLINVKKLSKGSLSNVHHFDSKAKVEEYIRDLGIPATFFLPGFYMSNIGRVGGALQPAPPDNVWTLGLPILPSAQIPLFDVTDTGKFVKGIVLNREKTLGTRVLGAVSYNTGEDILKVFKSLFPEAGESARYFQLPEEMFRVILKSQGTPDGVVTELYENLRLIEEFGYYGGESLDESHAIVKDPLTTWNEYAQTKAGGFENLK